MKLIVISSSKSFEKESQILTTLFEKGLQTLHLRKPRYSTPKLKRFLNNIPSKFHNRIIIHSHHNLALNFNLKGIHLTKKHKRQRFKTWFMLRILYKKKPDLLISTSYSKLADIAEAEKPYSYVFLSPIFDSETSKYQAGFTEHSLKSILNKSSYTVVARGGVDVCHIAKVNELGFSGLSINSSIWDKDDPVAFFNLFTAEFERLSIPIE